VQSDLRVSENRDGGEEMGEWNKFAGVEGKEWRELMGLELQ